MKKYILLGAATVLTLAAVLVTGQTIKNSILRVDVVKISPIEVENSVVCTGRVESVDESTVYAPEAAVTQKVYVQVGDRVSAGEKLADLTISSPNSDAGNPYAGTPSADAYQAAYEYLSNSGSASSAPEETQSVTSPTSGIVTSVSTPYSGYFIDSGKPMFEIKGDDSLQVRLDVNESQISDIKVGQPAQITGVGFKNSTYSGKVKSISSDAQQIASTTGQETVVEVVISVEDAGADIKPGFTAKAKIITSRDPNVLLVPYEAVKADKDGNEYVYKLVGKKAIKTPIVTEKEYDDGFQVIRGISPNDCIINNQDNLTDGEHVIAQNTEVVSSLG